MNGFSSTRTRASVRGRTLLHRGPFFLLLLSLVIAGCSTTYQHPDPSRMAYKGNLQSRLQQHYRRWVGTPYRLGGLSKKGIDCSGFALVTYRDVFGVDLPRSTDELEDVGESVAKADTRVGDLLIFKTGLWQQHVGIYVGAGNFIHASTSRGVMTSSLHSEYWADAYRDTRRVLAY